jgi:signal transduction histidine kinase
MNSPAIAPPRLIAFIQRHWARIRIALHIVLWVVTFGLAFYTTSFIAHDDNFVKLQFAPGLALLTLLYFYISGYILFPRYLYHFHPIKLLLSTAFVFFFIHLCTYALLFYLHTYNPVSNKFIDRYWQLFEANGLTGCFTSLYVLLLNFLSTINIAYFYLVPKVAKDLVVILSRSLQLERDNIQLERDNLDLELSFLKAQVNPHFLLNTLNSVYARIFEADQQAADLVLHLAELMRYNLYETDQPRISLDKELAYIQHYLDLERSRLADQLVLIDYEQSGQPAHYQIAPLLLIAFVENAFKHGVKGATQPAYVQVRADVDNNGHFAFTVENSLPQRPLTPTTTEMRSGGVGLANVRRRLEALYTGQYTLDTTADQQAYTVTLTVQLEPTTDSIHVY